MTALQLLDILRQIIGTIIVVGVLLAALSIVFRRRP